MMSHSSSKQSVRRAEYTLKNDMVNKEFWVVDGEHSNIDLLQEVLDMLYDSYKNCYTAEVSNNQCTSRLNIKCNVCNSALSSYDPFISHDKGKSHKKALQQALSKESPQLPNLFGPVVFKKLHELDNYFEPGTLEDKLFLTSHVVLGWQFVYREILDERELYTCQLCLTGKASFRMTHTEAFNHITSYSHTTKYMSVKFNINGHYNAIYSEILEVLKMEGKIQCKILTIRNTFGMKSPPRNKNLKTVSRTVSPASNRSSRSSTLSSSRGRRSSGSSSRTPERKHKPKRCKSRSLTPISPDRKNSSPSNTSERRKRHSSKKSSRNRSRTPKSRTRRSSKSSSSYRSYTPRHSSRSSSKSCSPERKHQISSSFRTSSSRSASRSYRARTPLSPSPPLLSPDAGLYQSMPRPKSPPKPVMKDVLIQMDKQPQSFDGFMKDVTRHYEYIAKKGDYTTDELKHDLDGQDLIIQLIKVLAQKLYMYGFTHDSVVKGDAESLLKKTESLDIPLLD